MLPQGSSIAQKRNLYKQIAERIERVTEITKNNLFIVVLENTGAENWSFGNGEIQELKHIKNNFIRNNKFEFFLVAQ